MRVSIVDVSMPFGSMVVFMIKWAFASIPAVLMIVIVSAIALGVFTAVVAPLGYMGMRRAIADDPPGTTYDTNARSPLLGLTRDEIKATLGAPSVDFGNSWIVGNRTLFFGGDGRVVRVVEAKQ